MLMEAIEAVAKECGFDAESKNLFKSFALFAFPQWNDEKSLTELYAEWEAQR